MLNTRLHVSICSMHSGRLYDWGEGSVMEIPGSGQPALSSPHTRGAKNGSLTDAIVQISADLLLYCDRDVAIFRSAICGGVVRFRIVLSVAFGGKHVRRNSPCV
jgi:hypothetical protein